MRIGAETSIIAVIICLFTLLPLIKIIYKRKIIKNIRRIIEAGSVEAIYSLLRSPRYVDIAIELGLAQRILDKFFDEGKFDYFLEACRILKASDYRCRALQDGIAIMAIDIETIVEEGRPRVREAGIYALSRSGIGFSYRREFSEATRAWLKSFLDHARPRAVVGHNIARHDIPYLESEGIRIDAPMLDTLTLSIIALPATASHSLEYLAKMFNIEYTPHVADEDARASLLLAAKLIGVLKQKRLLSHVIRLSHRELEALPVVDSVLNPQPTSVQRSGRERGTPGDYDVVVVPRVGDSCRADVWCPRKIPASVSDMLEKLDGVELLAAIVMASALLDGMCDGDRLLEKTRVREDIAEAVNKLCRSICFKPDVSYARIVEARYLRLFAEGLAGKRRVERLLIDGLYASALEAGLSVEELVGLAKSVAEQIVARTVAPGLARRHGVAVEGLRLEPVKGVSGCAGIGARNVGYIFGFVKRIAAGDAGVLAALRSTQTACQRLNLKTINNLRDIVIIDRIVIPTRLDLELFARKSSRLRGVEFLTGLRELYPSKEFWVVQGWKTLGVDIDPVDVEPEEIRVELYPVLFKDRIEAIEANARVVKRFWGFELRPYQKRAVLHLLQPYIEGLGYPNPLTVVILPTGAGKSVIFQSTALTLNSVAGGVTIVISPLLALIEDQVAGLRRRGIEVCRIDGTVSRARKLECLERALKGEVPLVYMTPEQLQNRDIARLLLEGDINYVVFDEAHSVTKWGRSFRPAYLYAIKLVRELREKGFWVPVALFTATLPDAELRSLLNELGVTSYVTLNLDMQKFEINEILVREPRVLKGPVLRTNIEMSGIALREPGERPRALVRVVKELMEWSDEYSGGKPWIGIVFTGFVKSSKEFENAEYIARYLSEEIGEHVAVFHGQLQKREKERIMEELYRASRGEVREPRIVVATKAFGMGVDIPNIRWIVHYMMSESIEDYYQEIGRGGRDGKIAKAVLLYVKGYDYKRRAQLIRSQLLRPAVVSALWKLINDLHSLGGARTLIIPLSLARARLCGIVSKLYAGARSGSTISELCEVLTEKALHVLASIGAIDYEITNSRAAPCRDGYPIARRGSEIIKLCIDSETEETIRVSPLDLTLAVDGRGVRVGGRGKYYIVTLNTQELPRDKVIDAIRKQGYMELSKLSSAMMLARYIVDGRVEEAKKIIEKYFELGMEEFEKEWIEEYLSRLAVRARETGISIRLGGGAVELLVPESIRRLERSRAKRIRAKAFAYGIAAALLRYRLVPDLTLALVPYGYAKDVKQYLSTLAEEADILMPLDVALHIYKAGSLTGRRPHALKDELSGLVRKLSKKEPIALIVAAHEQHKQIVNIIRKSISDLILVPVILRYV